MAQRSMVSSELITFNCYETEQLKYIAVETYKTDFL